MEPNTVELVKVGDKSVVIKSGSRMPVQYAEYSEIIAMPQMKEVLTQLKQQMELESAFNKRIDQYKKGLTLDKNDAYLKAIEDERKAQEEEFMKMLQQAQKQQESASEQQQQPSGVVAT